MASIFTYDPNPPRVSSPWSTPGRVAPQPTTTVGSHESQHTRAVAAVSLSPIHLTETGITRLEAEPQDGPTEYKLHLLLRPRRTFTSISTLPEVAAGRHTTPYLAKAGLRTSSHANTVPMPPPSTHSRQMRLQQLTTQLLWRLQQSSPFHSCSTADLVLPKLPEATPKLGVPTKPANLLPGLEESQGALYEIGVSDDGTFVGLTTDELDESLTNLKAMAASLGCTVDVLRKVVVGSCEWTQSDSSSGSRSLPQVTAENLFVAEALIRPDLNKILQPSRAASTSHLRPMELQNEPWEDSHVGLAELDQSRIEQLRVSITGVTTSGKSSLLGTLTTSTLDNGRGKSRLNLLKHRHEIASGVTSSVAQELVGYRKVPLAKPTEISGDVPEIINYASENVSCWNDIHASAARMVFLSDSPGLLRYAKSAIRTLVSWKPHWTIFCSAADLGDDNNSLTATESLYPSFSRKSLDQPDMPDSSVSPLVHLELCLKLNLPVIIAVTKMDAATKASLRYTLSRLLSVVKSVGRKPVLMNPGDARNQSNVVHRACSQYIDIVDKTEVKDVVETIRELGSSVVPIVMTSAVTGQGFGKLHALLKSVPMVGDVENIVSPSVKIFQIDEVFAIPPSKVYSSETSNHASDGIVLCGYVASGSLCIGDNLGIAPCSWYNGELVESEGPYDDRTASSAQSSGHASLLIDSVSPSTTAASALTGSSLSSASATCLTLRVVSLRNLRLPTRSLLKGQVGTIGVELIGGAAVPSCDLRRVRKGMVLASFQKGETAGYHSFTARFPSSDFKAADSPPLILGGHATAYINSIRAAVRVTSVTLAHLISDNEFKTSDDSGIFTLDGDQHAVEKEQKVSIQFSFVSSVEWMQHGDRVLIIPNAAAPGPVTGGPSFATGGLNGFVGTISGLTA